MSEYTPSDEDAADNYVFGRGSEDPGLSLPELRAEYGPEFDRFLARVRRDAAREVGQYIERHHPDGLTEKTTVLGYIDTAADRMGRGIHANGRDRDTP